MRGAVAEMPTMSYGCALGYEPVRNQVHNTVAAYGVLRWTRWRSRHDNVTGPGRARTVATTIADPGAICAIVPPDFGDRIRRMIRIAITPAAYAAIAATLALGTVAVEPDRAEDGSVHIWLDQGVVARLKALRGPGESYSDVILRLAKGEGV